MAMKLIEKGSEKIVFTGEVNLSLANAIRRSVDEIKILAIDEVDVYRNDSALYDEVIAHRMGLVPLKNQKLKEGQFLEMKLKGKGKNDSTEILAGELGKEVVYPETPLVLLENGQAIELVARAKQGKGIEHAKFSPGVLFYKHLPKIKISGEGFKQSELAEVSPESFEFTNEKLSVKKEYLCELDEEDMKNYPGVEIKFNDELVFTIESWGQIEAKEIFSEACKTLKENLSEVSKAIK